MISLELQYSILLFVLFVVPKVLARWRVPTGITALALGAFSSIVLGWFGGDQTVRLLSTLGIIALFLFAGLDVDFREIRKGTRVLVGHVIVQLLVLVVALFAIRAIFDLPYRASTVLALALVTPSTGFILDSLGAFGLNDEQKFWTKSKAIATELVALATLFLVMQSGSLAQLLVSSAVLVGLVLVLPALFRLFARFMAPYAPDSEFAFLLILALIAGTITRKLGAYYLVGAFLVGVAAQRYRVQLPTATSDKMLHAMKLFSAFFIPFYFFKAGLGITANDLRWESLVIGVAFIVTVIPLRLFVTTAHRRLELSESFKTSMPVATALIPTLVFGLVLAGILRNELGITPELFGALVLYTVGSSLIPAFLLRSSNAIRAFGDNPADSSSN